MRVYVYVRVLYIPTRTHAEVGKYTRTVVVGGGGVAGSPIKGQDLRSEFYGANDVVSVAVVGATQKPARTKDVAHPGGLPDMFIGYGVCVYPRGSSVVGSRVRGPVFLYDRHPAAMPDRPAWLAGGELEGGAHIYRKSLNRHRPGVCVWQ